MKTRYERGHPLGYMDCQQRSSVVRFRSRGINPLSLLGRLLVRGASATLLVRPLLARLATSAAALPGGDLSENCDDQRNFLLI